MKKIRIVLAGGSGLVGQHVTEKLAADDRCQLLSILRSNPESPGHFQILPLDTFLSEKILPPCDVVCITLGTTIKKAGSQDAFREVDYALVLTIATRAREAGAWRCVVVTALGSDPSSSVFYSRVKGEVEQELQKMGFTQLIIIRPSLLLGHRKEVRKGEVAGAFLARFVSFLLIGRLRRYRPVEAEKVAQCMVDAVLIAVPEPKLRIIESEEI